MIYVLYGENETEINKFIEKLKTTKQINDYILYNYTDTTILDIIEECAYTDLFGTKKLIVVNDATFLTGKSSLESEEFISYINNPTENILVLKIVTEKLDERKKIVKLLKEKAIVKEFKPLDYKNITEYIKNYFNEKEYKIDNYAINEIKNRLDANTKVLDKELEKLIIYKINEKEITREDVEDVIIKYEKDNIFKLVEAVTKKDKKLIFDLYKKIKDEKIEEVIIISLLASQFHLLLSAKILSEKGLDKKEIATKLKEHPYRTELAINTSRFLSKEELKSILYKLAELDINIKTGEMDKEKALETFFLEL